MRLSATLALLVTAAAAAGAEPPVYRLGDDRLLTQSGPVDFRYTPDGKAIVGLDEKRQLYRWDAATGRKLKQAPLKVRAVTRPGRRRPLVIPRAGGGRPARNRSRIELRLVLGVGAAPHLIGITPDGAILVEHNRNMTTYAPRTLADVNSVPGSLASFMGNLSSLQGQVDFHDYSAADGVTLISTTRGGATHLHALNAREGLMTFSDPLQGGEYAAGARLLNKIAAVVVVRNRGRPIPGKRGRTPDRTVTVIELRGTSKRRVWHTSEAAGRPGRVAVSRGRHLVAAGLTDGDAASVSLFDSKAGKPVGRVTLPGKRHPATPVDAAFSADGKRLVASAAGRAFVYSIDEDHKATLTATIDLGSPITRRPRFSPDGKTVAALDPGGEIVLFDAATGEPRFPETFSRRQVTRAAVTPDGRHAVTGGSDGRVRVWRLSDGRFVRDADAGLFKKPAAPAGRPANLAKAMKLMQPLGVTGRVAATPDGRVVIGRGRDGRLCAANAATGRVLWHFRWRVRDEHFDITPDGAWLLAAGPDGHMNIGRIDRNEGPERPTPSTALAAPAGQTPVSLVRLIEVDSGRTAFMFKVSPDTAGHVRALGPNGRYVVMRRGDGGCVVKDLKRWARHDSLRTNEPAKLWTLLADAAPNTAAIWRLVDTGDKAVALLREEWGSRTPAGDPGPTPTPARVRLWAGQLGSRSFRERETATLRLIAAGPLARAAVEDALPAARSPEVGRRLRRVKASMRSTTLRPAELRWRRAVYVLRQIDTPAARRLLADIAKADDDPERRRRAMRAD